MISTNKRKIRVINRDFGAGGLARDSRQNSEVSQISKKKCKKRGLKWLSCTLFGEKLAKYVLIVNDYIDYYQKAREALQKF